MGMIMQQITMLHHSSYYNPGLKGSAYTDIWILIKRFDDLVGPIVSISIIYGQYFAYWDKAIWETKHGINWCDLYWSATVVMGQKSYLNEPD